MPHTDVIPTSASIASVGLNGRYIGSHFYAYSGVLDIVNTTTATVTALEFTSGSGYITGKLQITLGDNTGSNSFMDVKLNDIKIIQNKWDDSGSSAVTLDSPILFIIPPFTKVEVLIGTTNSNTITMGVLLTGRVYGAV